MNTTEIYYVMSESTAQSRFAGGSVVTGDGRRSANEPPPRKMTRRSGMPNYRALTRRDHDEDTTTNNN